MPLLPRKNTLDFNPDATVLASKKLSAIALERMKNPVEDPDRATLSTIQAQKNLSTTFNSLMELSGTFHSLVLRIQNLLATRGVGAGRMKVGKKKMKGGAGEYDAMFPDDSTASTGSSVSVREFRRNPQRYIRDDSTASSGWSNFTDLSSYLRNLANDRRRFRDFYNDDDRNSSATPASSGGFDFDDAYSIPDSRFSGRPFSSIGDDSSFSSEPVSSLTMPSGVGEERNWTSLIFHLITITRRINILLNSSVKPAITSLSQQQINTLSKIYLMINSSYNDITRPLARRMIDPVTQRLTGERTRDPFTGVVRNPNPNAFQEVGFGMADENLIQLNQYGDEILNTFNSARQELLLTLTVIINSWKQNTPTGQQTELGEELERDFQLTTEVNRQLFTDQQGRMLDDDSGVIRPQGAGRKPRGRPRKTGAMTLVGNGRNFYGEQINHSRDIPTIFSGALRNCPTKYLL